MSVLRNIRLSSTTIISLGLAATTVSLVLFANAIGLVPDSKSAVIRARAQMCELAAAPCAAMFRPIAIPPQTNQWPRLMDLTRTLRRDNLPSAAEQTYVPDVGAMSSVLAGIRARAGDLLYVGIRRDSGDVVAFDGTPAGSGAAVGPGEQFVVPIFSPNGRPWGQVEFVFSPIAMSTAGAWAEALPDPLQAAAQSTPLRLSIFVAVTAFLCFCFYLRRTLRHLDPSAVIPPRVRAMLDALAEGVVVLDRAGRIVMANEAFSRAVSRPIERLQGMSASDLGWTDGRSSHRLTAAPWDTALERRAPVRGTAVGLASEGRLARLYVVNAAPVLGPDGSPRGVLATFDDLTEVERLNAELRRANDELERLATTDGLTGCLNRRAFLQRFNDCWTSAHATAAAGGDAGTPGDAHKSVACVMIDVDKFKSINDRFGHPVGDRVLVDVARVLQDSLDPALGDLVCRYGGEEFCALLPGRDMAGAALVAERIRHNIQSNQWPFTPVTASLGVSATRPIDGTRIVARDAKELLDQADRALYASKHNGRNRVTRWDEVPPQAHGSEEVQRSPATDVPRSQETMMFSVPVSALTTILAHCDNGTAVHSRRVADLCLQAAPGLIKVGDIATLEAAALLHDIGKIGIPTEILHKPSPLTKEEYEVMRAHDQISVDILMAAGVSSAVVQTVAAHHARYDRPNMLSQAEGEESAARRRAARLLCVADAYDAMTSDRPYRKAMSPAAAAEELRRCATSQFDAATVGHFLRAIQLPEDQMVHHAA